MPIHTTNWPSAPAQVLPTPTTGTGMNAEGTQLANLAAWHLVRIGNTGVLSAPPEPGTSQPLGSIPNPAATQRRVWLDPPPGSTTFDFKGFLALPLTTTGVDTVVVTFTVPQGLDGVINYISNNVLNNPTPFVPGTLVWRILINGRPVSTFTMIETENGTTFQGRIVSPIRIFSGDIVTYTVATTATAVTGQTVCSFSGYFFPNKGVS